MKTAVDAANYFRKAGSAVVVPQDLGSTDASIVPGIRQLISLALALTTH